MSSSCTKTPLDGWALTVRHWLAPNETAECAGAAAAAKVAQELAPHSHTLVPERLRAAGLDMAYESVVEPELVAALKGVCSACAHTDRCTHDFAGENSNERVAQYCPNTPAIDELIVERAIGKTV